MSAMEETDWRVVKRSRQQLKAIPDDVLEHAECVVSLDISGSSFTDLSNLSLLRKFQNLTSLNLDYCGLNRLPEELFDLVKVQTLSLKRNNLGKGLNASIGKLKALEVLNVADCELSDLPEELWSLEKLENLSLSGNKMAHGLSASISKLQSLKELDIMQCALSNLPEDLWNLQKLEKLSLSGNKMEKGLSASISKLQALKELDVFFCQLSDLPEELWSLDKLEKLSLRGNKMKKGLSASIGKLQALKELNVGWCELSDLPEEMWNLKKLENLSLSGNEMAHGLSASISKLQSLKELVVMECDLCDLPEELWNLQKLEKLSLWGNKMKKGLSASISKLQALKELDVARCELSDLPEELWSLENLEKLSLRGNKMELGLSASISKLQALKELDVTRCLLSDLPEQLWSLEKLEKLSLRGNKMKKGLSASISKLQALKELDVGVCELSDLPEELWSLENLETLRLSGNKMLKGLSPSISKVKSLKNLDVSHCELSDLPEELWSLENLEMLWLSGNKMLKGLSPSISKVKSLMVLNVSDCELSDLPEELWSLENLEILLLGNNRLASYPTGSLSLPKLRFLDLSNVPYTLDFTSHLQEEPKGKDEPQVFEDCIHSVPRSLCHLISKDSFTDKEQEEIAKFYKNLEDELMHENQPHDEPTMKLRETTGEEERVNENEVNIEYDMRSSPHGVCIIINNVNFNCSFPFGLERLARCEGYDVSAENLKVTFEELGYSVRQEDDLKPSQIVELLTKVSQINHDSFDSFVCCILSHGDDGYVYGSDSRRVSINKLTELFEPISCPSLANKPKMFFINACRGNNVDSGFTYIRLNPSWWSLFDRLFGARRFNVSKIPITSDFLLGFCTVSGYVAYAYPSHGAPYMNELCKVLKSYRRRSHLLDMLTEVNRRIAEHYNFEGEKQMPQPIHQLRGKVFFRKLTSEPKRPAELDDIRLSSGQLLGCGEHALRIVFACLLLLVFFLAALAAFGLFHPDSFNWLNNVLPWYRIQPLFNGWN